MDAHTHTHIHAHTHTHTHESLAEHFEAHRAHLRAVAYRMLGALSEAEDAAQEAWLKASRSDTTEVANLGGWLTTVVGRVCLDMLRSRTSRREEPIDAYEYECKYTHVPDPLVSRPDRADSADSADPEHQALLSDAVGLALLVVLETLPPAERLAFVLHDMFAVPFDDIAPIVERTPAATRQLASRARRRVQVAPPPEADLGRQRQVVDAFLAASRGGDFEALLALLDPDVVLRADAGAEATGTAFASRLVRGAQAVVEQALMFSRFSMYAQPALVNGTFGLVTEMDGQTLSVMHFTIRDGKIAELNILADRDHLSRIGLPALDG